MVQQRSPLAIIFVTVFIDLIGFGIVIPILPLYSERFGASPIVIGALLGVYSLMQLIFAPILGRLSDRVGRRPVLLVSLIGTAIGFLIMGLAQTIGLLFMARIIDGMTGGNISTALAYVADVTPPEKRSGRMGLIGAAFGLGFIFGPAIGGVLSHISLSAPFFFAAVLALANAAAVYAFLPESLSSAHRRQAFRERLPVAHVFKEARSRSLAVVLATYFFTTAGFSLLTATYPLFTERRFGYGAAENGYIFAAQGLLGAIIQGGLLGFLVRRLGEKGLVMAGTAILTIGFFALPISSSLLTLLLATAAIAIGHGLVAAPLNGLASKNAGPASQGRVLGIMQSTASLSRMVGPLLGGWLLHYDLIQLAAPLGKTPYWVGGSLMLIAFWLAAAL